MTQASDVSNSVGKADVDVVNKRVERVGARDGALFEETACGGTWDA